MNLKTALLSRRSIRKYSDRKIEKNKLENILMYAKHAPTGRNNQGLKFYMITNENVIKDLEEGLKKALDQKTYSLRGLKAFLLVMSDRNNPFNLVDTACAMMNIYYGAMEEGLGACWINQLKDTADSEYIRPILTRLGIENNFICYGAMALGYPDENPAPKERTMYTEIIE